MSEIVSEIDNVNINVRDSVIMKHMQLGMSSFLLCAVPVITLLVCMIYFT